MLQDADVWHPGFPWTWIEYEIPLEFLHHCVSGKPYAWYVYNIFCILDWDSAFSPSDMEHAINKQWIFEVLFWFLHHDVSEGLCYSLHKSMLLSECCSVMYIAYRRVVLMVSFHLCWGLSLVGMTKTSLEVSIPNWIGVLMYFTSIWLNS